MLKRRIIVFVFLFFAFLFTDLIFGEGIQLLNALASAVIFIIAAELVMYIFNGSKRQKDSY